MSATGRQILLDEEAANAAASPYLASTAKEESP
jgi:hypothetical protein